jgi:hypothetical protein
MNRRGFLKSLGKGAAVGAAIGTPAALAADYGKGKDVTGFNFACGCGNNVIATVPEVESEVKAKCRKCGKNWRLLWKGDHFQTFSGERTQVARSAEPEHLVDSPKYREAMKRIGGW